MYLQAYPGQSFVVPTNQPATSNIPPWTRAIAPQPQTGIETPAVPVLVPFRSAGAQPAMHLFFAGKQRKIMSYNCQNYFRTRDGHVFKKEKSVRALAEVILRENPDVLTLQEVGDASLLHDFNKRYLGGRYPNIISLPLGKDDNGRGIQVGMMAKGDLHVVDRQSHWTAQNAGRAEKDRRDFLEATFETDTGYRFTVFTGHFKSMRGGEAETMAARLSEAKSAGRILKQRFIEEPHARIVVTGDLNTHHTSKYGKPVLDALSLKADGNPDNNLTEALIGHGEDGPTHPQTKRHAESKLDYIYVSPAAGRDIRDAHIVGAFKQFPWSLASDHLPVVAAFEEPDDLPTVASRPRPQPLTAQETAAAPAFPQTEQDSPAAIAKPSSKHLINEDFYRKPAGKLSKRERRRLQKAAMGAQQENIIERQGLREIRQDSKLAYPAKRPQLPDGKRLNRFA